MYLFSLVANVIILAAAPLCTTSGPYLANRILLGFFGSPVESLAEISITDIWFAHERPQYLAWYGWSLALCGKLAPFLSGFINVGMGWKWTLWWCSIWNAIAFVYCFLFMEETNYDRQHPTRAHPAAQPVSGCPDVSVKGAEEKISATQKDADYEAGDVQWVRKTYMDKLSMIDKKRPNRILEIMIAPFKGFTYPAIVYAG